MFCKFMLFLLSCCVHLHAVVYVLFNFLDLFDFLSLLSSYLFDEGADTDPSLTMTLNCL